MANTLTIVEPIWPVLQKLSKLLHSCMCAALKTTCVDYIYAAATVYVNKKSLVSFPHYSSSTVVLTVIAVHVN